MTNRQTNNTCRCGSRAFRRYNAEYLCPQCLYQTIANRLQSTAKTLERIELMREMRGDESLGRCVEAYLVNRELVELCTD